MSELINIVGSLVKKYEARNKKLEKRINCLEKSVRTNKTKIKQNLGKCACCDMGLCNNNAKPKERSIYNYNGNRACPQGELQKVSSEESCLSDEEERKLKDKVELLEKCICASKVLLERSKIEGMRYKKKVEKLEEQLACIQRMQKARFDGGEDLISQQLLSGIGLLQKLLEHEVNLGERIEHLEDTQMIITEPNTQCITADERLSERLNALKESEKELEALMNHLKMPEPVGKDDTILNKIEKLRDRQMEMQDRISCLEQENTALSRDGEQIQQRLLERPCSYLPEELREKTVADKLRYQVDALHKDRQHYLYEEYEQVISKPHQRPSILEEDIKAGLEASQCVKAQEYSTYSPTDQDCIMSCYIKEVATQRQEQLQNSRIISQTKIQVTDDAEMHDLVYDEGGDVFDLLIQDDTSAKLKEIETSDRSEIPSISEKRSISPSSSSLERHSSDGPELKELRDVLTEQLESPQHSRSHPSSPPPPSPSLDYNDSYPPQTACKCQHRTPQHASPIGSFEQFRRFSLEHDFRDTTTCQGPCMKWFEEKFGRYRERSSKTSKQLTKKQTPDSSHRFSRFSNELADRIRRASEESLKLRSSVISKERFCVKSCRDDLENNRLSTIDETDDDDVRKVKCPGSCGKFWYESDETPKGTEPSGLIKCPASCGKFWQEPRDLSVKSDRTELASEDSESDDLISRKVKCPGSCGRFQDKPLPVSLEEKDLTSKPSDDVPIDWKIKYPGSIEHPTKESLSSPGADELSEKSKEDVCEALEHVKTCGSCCKDIGPTVMGVLKKVEEISELLAKRGCIQKVMTEEETVAPKLEKSKHPVETDGISTELPSFDMNKQISGGDVDFGDDCRCVLEPPKPPPTFTNADGELKAAFDEQLSHQSLESKEQLFGMKYPKLMNSTEKAESEIKPEIESEKSEFNGLKTPEINTCKCTTWEKETEIPTSVVTESIQNKMSSIENEKIDTLLNVEVDLLLISTLDDKSDKGPIVECLDEEIQSQTLVHPEASPPKSLSICDLVCWDESDMHEDKKPLLVDELQSASKVDPECTDPCSDQRITSVSRTPPKYPGVFSVRKCDLVCWNTSDSHLPDEVDVVVEVTTSDTEGNIQADWTQHPRDSSMQM